MRWALRKIGVDEWLMAPNDTTYTRWSCHSGLANIVQIVSAPPDYRFLGKPAMLFIKAGDVKTNPGLTLL